MALKKRTQSPRLFSDYRSYKRYLRLDFDHRCAYCEIHEAENGGSGKFHIDHYQPKKQFPERICDYTNLFYSCGSCNGFKGDFWPTFFDRWWRNIFVLNPCDHDFDDHYDRAKPEWLAKTSTATWNIKTLRLNAPQTIQLRKDRLQIKAWIAELERQQKDLRKCLNGNKKNDTALKKKIEDIQEKIDTLKRKIEMPTD